MSRSTPSRRSASCPACSRRCAQAQTRGLQARHGHQPGRARQRELSAGGLRRAAPVHARRVQLAGHRVRRGVRVPASQERRLRLPQAEDQAGRGLRARAGVDLAAQRDGRRSRHGPRVRAATSACAALRVRRHGTDAETWPAILARAHRAARAIVQRKTKETDIDVDGEPRRDRARSTIVTGIGFFDHMLEQLAKHGGFALQLECHGDLRDRRAPHRRGLRAGARRGAAQRARRQARHRALRVRAADGRGAGARRHRSVRARLRRVRRQVRARSRRRPADRAGAAFLPLARREPQGAPFTSPSRARTPTT